MFAFAKQLVRSTEAIISQNAGLPPTQYNHSSPHGGPAATYDDYRGFTTGLPEEEKREDPKYGFRVLRVTPGSKCERAGVESLFDYVVGIDGVDIEQVHLDDVQKEEEQERDQLQEKELQATEGDEKAPSTPVSTPPKQPTPPAHPQGGRHKRGSLSFASMSGILAPQIRPPEPEVAPLDVFMDIVQSYQGSVTLDLWSSKGRTRRSIVLTLPNTSDQENGTNEKDNEKNDEDVLPGGFWLGMTLQWTPLTVADHVWHVLSVAPDSPAEKAGLISHSDYIVGGEGGCLSAGGEDLLGRVVQRLVQRHALDRRSQLGVNGNHETGEVPPQAQAIVDSVPELELYVYNHEYGVLRAVRIRPNARWGGSGLLGCNIGYGLLHRLPAAGSSSNISNYSVHDTSAAQGVLPKRSNSRHNRSFSGSFNVASGSLPPGGTLFDLALAEAEDEEDQYQAEDERNTSTIVEEDEEEE